METPFFGKERKHFQPVVRDDKFVYYLGIVEAFFGPLGWEVIDVDELKMPIERWQQLGRSLTNIPKK